ncbi:hypothetical protein F4678DRAFT_418259, partial [Xylaria arbuscula]
MKGAFSYSLQFIYFCTIVGFHQCQGWALVPKQCRLQCIFTYKGGVSQLRMKVSSLPSSDIILLRAVGTIFELLCIDSVSLPQSPILI